MKFGVREICDVVFRAKAAQKIGNRQFYRNEPVLYFDTLRTSSLEGAATTVYAQGGRGYTRLIAWEGERTLTFTMEDALLSPESFSILSGAGLIDATEKPLYVHQTSQVEVATANTIVIPDLACWTKEITTPATPAAGSYQNSAADIFVMVLDGNGEVDAEPCIPVSVTHNEAEGTTTLTCYSHTGNLPAGSIVLVDYYVMRTGGAQQIEITAEQFGGYFYVEASTLFRRQADGVDMPAEFIIPNCKVQSNFTFTMAANGDPSVFTFTLDAFPDYTKFDRTKKVLAAIQVISDEDETVEGSRTPCQAQIIASYDSEAADVTARLTSNTENAATIEVSGSVTGQAFDTVNFGSKIQKGVQIDITVPVMADSAQYEVISKNPAYPVYFEDDPRIDGDVKTQTVAGSKITPISVILTPESASGTPVTLEITGLNNNFRKTYIINNKANFVDGASSHARSLNNRSAVVSSLSSIDDHE